MWGSVRPASQQHTLQSTEQKWSKVLLRPNIRSPNHSPQNPVSSGDSSSVSRRRGKCLQFAAIGWTFGCKYVVYTHTKSGRCREWEAVEFGKQLCDNSSMKLSMSQTGCMTTNNNWKQFHEREYLPSCYASSIINRRTLNTPFFLLQPNCQHWLSFYSFSSPRKSPQFTHCEFPSSPYNPWAAQPV